MEQHTKQIGVVELDFQYYTTIPFLSFDPIIMTKTKLTKLLAMLLEHQETHRKYIKENDQYKDFDEGVIKGLDLAISTIGYVLNNK